jgi:hypothetical protein
VRNITPKKAGASTTFDQILERRDYRNHFNVTPEQARLIDDTHEYLDGLNQLREANGLRAFKPQDENYVHIARAVQGIRDVDVVNRPNSFLARVYETMDEGRAAGITYSNDLRGVLGLMGQTTYRDVALSQLDRMVAGAGAVTAKSVIAQTHPTLIRDLNDSIKELTQARRVSRDQRSLVVGTRSQMDTELLRHQKALTRAQSALTRAEVTASDNAARLKRDAPAPHLQTRVDEAKAKVDSIQAQIDQTTEARKNIPDVRTPSGPAVTPAAAGNIDAARTKYEMLKKQYSRTMENVSKSTVLPGYVFGKTERDISVGTWKGKFLPNDADYKHLADRMNVITARRSQ